MRHTPQPQHATRGQCILQTSLGQPLFWTVTVQTQCPRKPLLGMEASQRTVDASVSAASGEEAGAGRILESGMLSCTLQFCPLMLTKSGA